ncbi:hypothetical protein ABBQ32_004405 [Trebouxia sp. C0010 RCD-2024]
MLRVHRPGRQTCLLTKSGTRSVLVAHSLPAAGGQPCPSSRARSSVYQLQDQFRFTEGIAQYTRQTYLAGAVKQPKVLVTKLRMLSRDVGAVSYRMRGSIATVPVDIDFEDVFELNLLTGRVLKHTESWDLSRCSLPGKVAFTASRLFWAARQQASDTKDGGSKLMESLSSMDEGDQQGFQANPNDPTRFFQGPPDNGNKDLIQGALVIAVLYLIYNTYSQIENIK